MMALLLGTVASSVFLAVAELLPTGSDNVVRVPAGKVTAELTNYPLYIDLSHMSDLWWSEVDAAGGNVRVYAEDGTTLLPHDVANIDKVRKTGRLYVKKTLLAASANTVTVKALASGTAALAVTDPNGRNAVWSDYSVSVVFPSKVNRTGLPGFLTEANLSIVEGETAQRGWGHANLLAAAINISGLVLVWSAGVTEYNLAFTAAARTILSVTRSNATSASGNNGAYLLWSASQAALATYNTSQGNLVTNPKAADTVNSPKRLAFGHNNAAERKVVVNGVPSIGVSVARPSNTGNDSMAIVLNGDYDSGGTTAKGNAYYQHLWLRKSYVSAAWLVADSENNLSPATFYTVSYATPVSSRLLLDTRDELDTSSGLLQENNDNLLLE
jgi:hypothetical protein